MVKDGESWARTRRAFGILLEQWGDGATLASQYIGGQSVSRDHKADKDARDPIVPVAGAKQRECLKFLTDSILADTAFQFSPALLRRLGTERWMHWGTDGFFGSGVDISVLERILGDPEDRPGPLPEPGDPRPAREPAAPVRPGLRTRCEWTRSSGR